MPQASNLRLSMPPPPSPSAISRASTTPAPRSPSPRFKLPTGSLVNSDQWLSVKNPNMLSPGERALLHNQAKIAIAIEQQTAAIISGAATGKFCLSPSHALAPFPWFAEDQCHESLSRNDSSDHSDHELLPSTGVQSYQENRTLKRLTSQR